jgi:hypothetical protein
MLFPGCCSSASNLSEMQTFHTHSSSKDDLALRRAERISSLTRPTPSFETKASVDTGGGGSDSSGSPGSNGNPRVGVGIAFEQLNKHGAAGSDQNLTVFAIADGSPAATCGKIEVTPPDSCALFQQKRPRAFRIRLSSSRPRPSFHER